MDARIEAANLQSAHKKRKKKKKERKKERRRKSKLTGANDEWAERDETAKQGPLADR